MMTKWLHEPCREDSVMTIHSHAVLQLLSTSMYVYVYLLNGLCILNYRHMYLFVCAGVIYAREGQHGPHLGTATGKKTI